MRSNQITAKKIDWWLIGLYFALTGMGLMNIYSASYNPEHSGLFDNSQEYGKQSMWLAVSFCLAGTILLLDGGFIRSMSIPFYLFCLFMLVMVVLVGTEVNGAKAWFGIGSFGIQPSEFSKVGLSMVLAWYLSSDKARQDRNRKLFGRIGVNRGTGLHRLANFILSLSIAQLWVLVIIVIPTALILLQPDMGTVIVFTGIILMCYREGISGNSLIFGFIIMVLAVSTLMLKDTTVDLPLAGKQVAAKYVIVIIISCVSLLAILVTWNLVMKRNRKIAIAMVIGAWLAGTGVVFSVDKGFEKLAKHQKERIDITLGLKEDPDGKGYNIDRAMASIGSGKLTGKGYMQATLANKSQKHVPMQSTDFIFCTWSEEWGFPGSFVVLFLFMFLLVRLVIIAERQRLAYTRIYAYCVACVFFMHVLINMGMAIGLVPVIGIPLPFFSYGGSSLMGFTILLFILIRLDAERLDVLK